MQHKMTSIVRAALLATTLSLPMLVHAEDKPDQAAYALHTKLLDAIVTIDAALKSFPGLYDNLLAEGKRAAAKWDAQAKKGQAGISRHVSRRPSP